MALNNHDQAKIRDYLLGHLTDQEQEQIEERFMTEDDLFQELEISKGELIEEYCANELTKAEQQWFKEHYLCSAEGRERHAFTLALDSLKRSVPAAKRLNWLERLQAFVKLHSWAVAIATSTALVVIVVGLFIVPRTPQTLPTSYAFTLNSTLSSRSSGDVRSFKVTLNPEIGELRITLQLPQGVARGTDYRVELDDRSETTNLKPVSHDANSVLVVIPTASLREGAYALRLATIKADGTEEPIAGEYRFELIRPSRSALPPKP